MTSSLLAIRLLIGGLAFAVPLGAGSAAAALAGAFAQALWFWPSMAVLSGGFGILGAVGFSYDIVREAVVDDRFVRMRTANRQMRYEWTEIEPRARVFPWQVRFRAHDGTVFFLTYDMASRIVALPFGPSWNLRGLGRW